MFGNYPEPKYDFQLSFCTLNDRKSYFTEVEKFAVRGGSKRTIRKNGENEIGDADIISEFYQAKQYMNLVVTVPLNLDTLLFQKVFNRKISFDFVLSVKSLSPQSRLRSLQLNAEKARLIKPPTAETELSSTLCIEYSNLQVFYWYQKAAEQVFETL